MSFGKKDGPLHGQCITQPYLTNDYLQEKRYRAHLNGTTYVYDIPTMIGQMVEKQWRSFSDARPQHSIRIPDKVLLSVKELVLNADDDKQLEQIERSTGNNQVTHSGSQ